MINDPKELTETEKVYFSVQPLEVYEEKMSDIQFDGGISIEEFEDMDSDERDNFIAAHQQL